MSLLNELFGIIEEGYKEAQSEFGKVSSQADGVIAEFRKLVDRNQFTGVERNIDYWRKAGWDAFNAAVVSKRGVATATQVKRQKDVGASITIANNSEWLIVVPLDKNASCYYGKRSSWCTAKPGQTYFEQYFFTDEVTLVYCIRKADRGMWAVVFNSDSSVSEIRDVEDLMLTGEEFEQQTALSVKAIQRAVFAAGVQDNVIATRERHKEEVKEVDALARRMHSGKRDTALEARIASAGRGDTAAAYIDQYYSGARRRVDVDSRLVDLAINPEAIDEIDELAPDESQHEFIAKRVNLSDEQMRRDPMLLVAAIDQKITGEDVEAAIVASKRDAFAQRYLQKHRRAADPLVTAMAIRSNANNALYVSPAAILDALRVAPDIIDLLKAPTDEQKRAAGVIEEGSSVFADMVDYVTPLQMRAADILKLIGEDQHSRADMLYTKWQMEKRIQIALQAIDKLIRGTPAGDSDALAVDKLREAEAVFDTLDDEIDRIR